MARYFLRVTPRNILRIGLLGLFIFPYLVWWRSFHLAFDFSGSGPIFGWAFVQAGLSAFGAMAVGCIFFLGLTAFQSKMGRACAEVALLAPNVLPPIFMILSLFVWIFPLGLPAVIGAHIFINAGLVAISFDRLDMVRLSGLAETAWVLGASRARFVSQVAWREVRGDVGAIFLFIFSLCFSSFSIPLLLSGGEKITPEIAIYDAIRVEGSWPRALLLALAQTLMLLIFARLIPAPQSGARRARHAIPLLSVRTLRFTVFVPALVLAFALGRSLTWPSEWIDAAALSLALGLSTGLLQLGLSLFVAYLLPHRALDSFLTGYLSPSPSIIGFGLLMIPLEGEWVSFIKLSVALTLLAFPLLYRGLIRAELGALGEQVRVARYLGASYLKIATNIVWPQALPSLLKASGLAAVWAAGDFALTGILADEKLKTLPYLMTDRMSQYQWAEAQALLLPLIAVVCAVYVFFAGASRYVAN